MCACTWVDRSSQTTKLFHCVLSALSSYPAAAEYFNYIVLDEDAKSRFLSFSPQHLSEIHNKIITFDEVLSPF
jgi:hypothetical protein